MVLFTGTGFWRTFFNPAQLLNPERLGMKLLFGLAS